MHKQILFLLFSLSVGLLTSCKPNKDLIYLNNITDQEEQTGLPGPVPVYLVKTADNLYIDIQTTDPEINVLFNPTKGLGTTGGTQQNFGQESSQYLNGFLVDIEGNVNLPIIGKVAVAGMSLPQVQDAVQLSADEYLKEAVVRVRLLSFKVTVMGEVKSPGVYYNYSDNLTILEGISLANGETDYSSIKKVLVLRPTPSGSQSYRLDLTNKSFLASPAFFLQPNDVVYVEPDKNKSVKINAPMYSLFLSTVSTLILVLNVVEW
jgi:polysaccharide export outer membrane protein